MASSSGKALRDHVAKHTTKQAKKPSTLLLKDYLRDDLSSCSSSGFKSFPRRQCCTTVGFRVEKDLQIQRKRIRNRPSSSSSSYFSTVSEAVMNAIKSLPLSQKRKGGAGVLSRSFSRKVLSRRFWRKAAKEEETVPRRRRRSFGELIMEDKAECEKTTPFNEDRDNNTVLATVPSFTTASSVCDSNSWVESDFTFSSTATSSNDVDSVEHYNERAPRHNMEGLTVTDWLNEKEQFSPVSVLDCAFEDEEFHKSHFNSNSTPDNSSCKGTKKEHMQKRQHFKGVVSLKPVPLEKRFACFDRTNVYHGKMEENAGDLLNMVKKSIECSKCVVINAENMLFDYFKQSIEEKKDMGHSEKLHLCKVAEDWIQGQQQELYLGWEVESGRCMYMKEMDKLGEWRNSDQEMQHLVVDLENHLFSDLVKDLVLDLTTSCASK